MLVLVCILLIFNTAFIIWNEKYISIAFVNSAMWAFLATSVLIFGFPARDKAYIFVLFNTLAFSITYLIVKGKIRLPIGNRYGLYYEPEGSDEGRIFDEATYNKLIKIVIILNIFSVIYLAYTLGFRLNTFTSISRLMAKMNSISSIRYSGDAESMPLINRLINAIVYASCAFSGYFMAHKARFVHLINLVLIVFQTIILNTKATLVFGLAFWVGGYLSSISFRHKKISVKSIIIALSATVAVLVFSAAINYFRHNGVIPFLDEFKRILSSYFIGPFSAFSMWFDSADGSSLELGVNTFSCVFRVFGIKAQEHGTGILLSDSSGTNVYTVYKHLVNDFSSVGTVLISAMLGFFGAIVDCRLRKGYTNSVNIAMVIFAVILVSFFSSLFRYTTNLVACIIIVIMPLMKRVTLGGKRIL